MTYGPPTLPPQAKPKISGVDLTISVIAILATILFGAIAAFFGVFFLAFMDTCHPETCSAEGAIASVSISLFAAAIVGLTGLVVTTLKLVRRNRAWPFAIGTFAVCVAVCGLGAVGFIVANGGLG